MTVERRKFRHEPAEARKEALILAALDLVAEKGVRGATVREIARRADVSQGLIRHYFSSKEELISAAYEYHMTQMASEAVAADTQGTARQRLTRFIQAGLQPPVMTPRAVALWAGFLNTVQQDPEMRTIHARTYANYRDLLETLIGAVLNEAERPVAPARLRQLAIASNAVLDGLWMEGGALPEAFAKGEMTWIGLESVGSIIGISLNKEEGQPCE